ncbi:MAG: TonB-dependent receptor, partial [Calditrichaeota bacterium]
FTSQGTTVSVGGGERDVAIGSIRHAGVMNDDVGYKFAMQYYEGNDWEHFEPIEPDSIALYRASATGNDTVKAKFKNDRDFKITKLSGEGRLDYLIGDNTSLVLNGGFNQASSIELTGLGAGQAIDWTYWYTQARINYKDFFVQGFVNASDAGDTYLLNTGQLIVDKSKLWVLQAQQRYAANEKTALTFGVDALFTRPNTESTINGRNENSDNINEYGFYVQGDHILNDKFKLVGAMRVDKNDQLEDPVYSPRGGIVFQPDANNNFRFTYNRAFSTPDNNNLFLDLMVSQNPFNTGYDLRVQGVPESGFHWTYDNSGDPMYSTAFDNFAGTYEISNQAFMDAAWQTNRAITTIGVENNLRDAGQSESTISAVSAMLDGVTPLTLTNVGNMMMLFDQDNLTFIPTDPSYIEDIERMKPTTTHTFEFGYKGIVNNKFQFSIDAYRTQKDNFVGPLTVENPTVHLNATQLQAELTTAIGTAYAGSDATTQATLTNVFDPIAAGGNGNGNPVDELVAIYTRGGAGLPFGVFTPEEQLDPNAVLITYRNFGEVTYYGTDLAFAYHVNQNWNFGGTYSYVSKNFFEKGPDQVHDIYLNAPKNKFGLFLRYVNAQKHLNSQIRFRWVEGFDMASPFFGTSVETYNVVDFNLGIDVIDNTHLSLTVQNLFDNMHTEFVGGAELGRLAIMRVTQTF